MNKASFALTAGTLAIAVSGCGFMAVQTAPPKVPASTRTELAAQADAVFWQTLHTGHYEGIGRALEIQTAAYLQNTGDAVSAAHTGWLHIWRLAESSRMAQRPATITDDAVLARKYFQEAVALDPTDARYAGFLGSALLAEGAIHRDEKLTRQGYYTLRASIDTWPEFNLFTAGYVVAGQPADSERFKEGLEWQWRNLEVCVGAPLNRQDPDPSRLAGIPNGTFTGVKRVCGNSWIAPHNVEGFFMNMGDMLVKAGQWQTAQKIYAVAQASPDYAAWPYKAALETRIQQAPQNVAAFNAPERAGGRRDVPMMGQSAFACMACHQK